jgi:hypothetical protein
MENESKLRIVPAEPEHPLPSFRTIKPVPTQKSMDALIDWTIVMLGVLVIVALTMSVVHPR